jgi:hypothetical protein
MTSSVCCQVDASSPSLVQGIRRGIDHAWKRLNALKLTQRHVWKDTLDGGAQIVIVDRLGEPTSEAHCRLLE